MKLKIIFTTLFLVNLFAFFAQTKNKQLKSEIEGLYLYSTSVGRFPYYHYPYYEIKPNGKAKVVFGYLDFGITETKHCKWELKEDTLYIKCPNNSYYIRFIVNENKLCGIVGKKVLYHKIISNTTAKVEKPYPIYDNLKATKTLNPDSVFGLSLNCAGYKKFPKEILKFKNLRYLDFSTRMWCEVPFLLNKIQVKYLEKKRNTYHKLYKPNSIRKFPEEISSLKHLETLDVDYLFELSDSLIIERLTKLLPNTAINPSREDFYYFLDDYIRSIKYQFKIRLGVIVEETYHYRNGQIRKKLNSKKYKEFYSNGKIKESVKVDKYGRFYGKYIKYNIDGSVIETIFLDPEKDNFKYYADDVFHEQ